MVVVVVVVTLAADASVSLDFVSLVVETLVESVVVVEVVVSLLLEEEEVSLSLDEDDEVDTCMNKKMTTWVIDS